MPSDEAIQRMIDESEIRNTIARMALETDMGDLDVYGSLFTEDARLEMRGNPGEPPLTPPSEGRAAILEGSKGRRASGITGPGSGMVHALQTSKIEVSGDRAQSQTYVVLWIKAQTAPELMGIRVYNDTLVRTAEGWKVAVRYIDPVPNG